MDGGTTMLTCISATLNEFKSKLDLLHDEYELIATHSDIYQTNFSCNYADDFEECMKYDLADNSNLCPFDLYQCYNENDENPPSRVSPSSFNFKEVGSGYTCQLNSVVYKYSYNFGLSTTVFKVGTVCVQVPPRNSFGNSITKQEAQGLMAIAWEAAETATHLAYRNEGSAWGAIAYKEALILNLQTAMLVGFDGTFEGNNMSLSTGKCLGNIRGRSLKYF